MSKKITFNCAWCGKEKTDWAYRKPRFCSRKCAFAYAAHLPKPWQVNRINLICPVCGLGFSVSVSAKRLRNSTYCSRECKGKAKSLSMRGKDNWNYIDGEKYYDRGPNWASQSRKARRRDGYNCQVCGKNGWSDKVKIEVHHIVPYRKFHGSYEAANNLENLVSLCRQCHVKVEKGKVPSPRRYPKQPHLISE